MSVKYIKQIQPLNKKQEYKDGEELLFELPENDVDITSFKMYYQAKADPKIQYSNGSYLKRFMPRISASIIQELHIIINGENAQIIKEYNLLHNIISDGLNERDPIDGTRYDTINYSGIGNNNTYITECDLVNNIGQTTTEPLYYDYFIVNLMGFLTEGQQFIDCKNNKIQIKIILAPSYISYEGLKKASPTNLTNAVTYPVNFRYTLKNVYANIDCYNGVTPQKEITFKDYKTNYGAVNDNGKNANLLVHHTGNINYILCTFIDKNRMTSTGLQLQYCNEDVTTFNEKLVLNYPSLASINTTFSVGVATYEAIKATCSENLLNNSLYFKRNGLSVKSCQLLHNGVNLTPNMNIYQLYLNAKDFFNGAFNRLKSIASFQNEFFIFPYNLTIDDDNFNSEIEWIVNNDDIKADNGGQPIMFLCYDKTINLK